MCVLLCAVMSIGRMTLVLALAAATACGKPKSEAKDETKPPAQAPAVADGYDAEALGALHFAVSGGTPEARQRFSRGLLALHSFWYDEAIKQFTAAIEADKTFAMAYWGLAMSHSKLLWGDDDLTAGRDVLKRMPAPNLLPPHDQAWVVAVLSLFKRAKVDVQSSRKEFLAVMEQVHAQFPDDESALFLALALLSTVRPNDPSEVQIRERAGELANEVFKRNPKHPGAAHYLIHAYDTPELATRALPAAQQYAAIAPAAFHALHMPAHIFSRLGKWKEAVVSCQAAWDASVAWVRRDKLSIDHQDFHSLTWLVEINFERGRRKDAERAMTTFSDAVRAGLTHEKRAAFANQVASFMARTGEWTRADELLAPLQAPAADADAAKAGSSMMCGGHAPLPSGPPTQLFERRAVLGARAQAAAMRHDQALLGRILEERDAVDAELHPFLVATQPKEFVDSADKLRVLVREALVARARNDDRALVAALRPLAVDQDDEFTGEGTAGGILHHEEIAEALLRLGQAKEALAEYRLVLAKHAGRARSLLGAARAATKAGDRAAARDYYQQLVTTWSEADEGTDGLPESRQAIATDH
jgi:tetratricopeptide (TPR) repeat protein